MKSALRQRLTAEMAGLDAGTVRAHSAAVWERLATLAEFQNATCICVYVSTGSEIETHGLIRQLLAHGRSVCIPAFAGKYVPAEVTDFDELTPGKFGILEPKRVIPAQPDLWLVPGIAFDAQGTRLGRGRGFYDQLLAGAGGTKIALAHEFQIQAEIPASPHDVRMDLIVTEKRLVYAKAQRR